MKHKMLCIHRIHVLGSCMLCSYESKSIYTGSSCCRAAELQEPTNRCRKRRTQNRNYVNLQSSDRTVAAVAAATVVVMTMALLLLVVLPLLLSNLKIAK